MTDDLDLRDAVDQGCAEIRAIADLMMCCDVQIGLNDETIGYVGRILADISGRMLAQVKLEKGKGKKS